MSFCNGILAIQFTYAI
uniref:Uncharacterized protein n=1 Tax=Anguilla anguilla TaxID=7936 RepID=A0A0E9VCX9_ANGAN